MRSNNEMVTLRCTKCQYSWESENVEQICPNCEERVIKQKFNRFIYDKQLLDRRERMHGRRVSDRERCCENEECGAPLKGYSYLEYDAVTGIAVITCESCQFEHVIEEGAARR